MLDTCEICGHETGKSEHLRLRADLVKIAFKKVLESSSQQKMSIDWAQVGRITVKAADTVLAEMEPKPDTGPSADEIARRARALAGELLTGLEKPILSRLRAKLQEGLTQDQGANAKNPTSDPRVLGYRVGCDTATAMAVRLIDAAMEKTGAAENDDAK